MTFDGLAVGDRAEVTLTLQRQDIELFAVMSGDVNPAHVDEDFDKSDMFQKVIAHGMWGGALISAVLGTELPGPGTLYLNQSLSFPTPGALAITNRWAVPGKQHQPGNSTFLTLSHGYTQPASQ